MPAIDTDEHMTVAPGRGIFRSVRDNFRRSLVPPNAIAHVQRNSSDRCWHLACPVSGRTMRRGTVLLIVMLLAGTPGVSLACELWCNTPAGETHHGTVGCHRAPDAGIPGKQVIATAVGCHEAATITAFVNEPRRPDTRPVTIVAAVSDTPAVWVRGHLTDEGWFIFNGQASRPSAFRTILRV